MNRDRILTVSGVRDYRFTTELDPENLDAAGKTHCGNREE